MAHDSNRALPVLPLRKGVALPGQSVTLPVSLPRSIETVRSLRPGDSVVLRPAESEVAVVARVDEVQLRGRSPVVGLETLRRVRVHSVANGMARVDPIRELRADTDEARALADALRDLVAELVPEEVGLSTTLEDAAPGLVADRVASALPLDNDTRLRLLRELDVVDRLRAVADHLRHARAEAELRSKVDSEVREELGRGQREQILRRQLRAIQKELGEGGDSKDDELRARLQDADLPDEVREVADRELERLNGLPPQSPETHVVRTYLEWIADLPWKVRSGTPIDLDAIEAALDADHHGLTDVKRRVLEHMAVTAWLARESAAEDEPDAPSEARRPRGSVLCLAGPPGVGKTSLAQAVADAIGRPLVRVSLGGVRDEAELRGHRRTYVGALPGRILSALRRAKVKDAVVVLDEIDKVAQRGWAGDPQAALLEVLDPQQNHAFVDHYVELPFDLSECLFLCTANDLSALSAPLRDRLEILELRGYATHEKVTIAREHLLPRVLREHGLAEDAVVFADADLEWLVQAYTREAGVRQLERVLAKIARQQVVAASRGQDARGKDATFEREALEKLLGRPRVPEPAEADRPAGVAAGLAWTPVGGDVLYVETARMPGKGKVEITGQLGDVMNESARTALAFLRTRAKPLGIDADFLERNDLHVHVPAGGTPKDGPSAGVTLFTALASLLTGRRVRPDTAMTGEATLRGRVLPVGGIGSKLLAAHRAGFTRVLVPQANAKDLDELPETVRDELDVHLVDRMDDVLELALEAAPLRSGPDHDDPLFTPNPEPATL